MVQVQWAMELGVSLCLHRHLQSMQVKLWVGGVLYGERLSNKG